MKKIIIVVFAALTMAFLIGCTNNEMGTTGGAVGGGLIGGVVSNGNPVATVGGAVVGGLVGNQLSR